MANPAPAGSDVSAGTYRCTNCGYELQVRSTKNLPPCPKCNNGKWNTVSGGDSVRDPYPGRKRGSAASGRSESSRTRSSSKGSSKRSSGSSKRSGGNSHDGRGPVQAVKDAVSGGVDTVKGGTGNGAGPVGPVKDAMSDGADTAKSGLQSAGEGIGGAARKAKLPALAGGAALAGLAGTLALTSGGLRSVRLPGMRPSRTKRGVKALAGAGSRVGAAGGQLSGLAQRADELTALVECVNKAGKRSKRRRLFRR